MYNGQRCSESRRRFDQCIGVTSQVPSKSLLCPDPADQRGTRDEILLIHGLIFSTEDSIQAVCLYTYIH